MASQEFQGGPVIAVVGVDVGIQRTDVDEERCHRPAVASAGQKVIGVAAGNLPETRGGSRSERRPGGAEVVSCLS